MLLAFKRKRKRKAGKLELLAAVRKREVGMRKKNIYAF